MPTRYRASMVLTMASFDLSNILTNLPDGITVQIKVVPRASRSRIAGLLGTDRLKLLVSAPASGGQANKAVCDLLAKTLGVSMRDVQIVLGHTQSRKTVLIAGMSLCAATEQLNIVLTGDGSRAP